MICGFCHALLTMHSESVNLFATLPCNAHLDASYISQSVRMHASLCFLSPWETIVFSHEDRDILRIPDTYESKIVKICNFYTHTSLCRDNLLVKISF